MRLYREAVEREVGKLFVECLSNESGLTEAEVKDKEFMYTLNLCRCVDTTKIITGRGVVGKMIVSHKRIRDDKERKSFISQLCVGSNGLKLFNKNDLKRKDYSTLSTPTTKAVFCRVWLDSHLTNDLTDEIRNGCLFACDFLMSYEEKQGELGLDYYNNKKEYKENISSRKVYDGVIKKLYKDIKSGDVCGDEILRPRRF